MKEHDLMTDEKILIQFTNNEKEKKEKRKNTAVLNETVVSILKACQKYIPVCTCFCKPKTQTLCAIISNVP